MNPQEEALVYTPTSQIGMSDRDVLESAEESFSKNFRTKFEAGMKKYVTPITQKDCLAELKQELMDGWAYLHAEMIRRSRALEIVEGLSPEKPMGLFAWKELIYLLSNKPLAVPVAKNTDLKPGDAVKKIGGDYTFVGNVAAIFQKIGNPTATRIVVEDDRGILHIYSPKNLEKL